MKMRVANRSRILAMLLMLMAMVFVVLSSSLTVRADGASTWANLAKSSNQYGFASSDESKHGHGYTGYPKAGGGEILGKDLIGTDGFINEANFKKLTSDGQTKFIHDLNEWAMYYLDQNPNSTTYTEDTLADWYAVLQTKDGVGTKFMNVILENTKPDFVAANRIYKPFSGLIGTAMGVIAVFMMGFLGIVMVADIAYITLPPVRLFVTDANEGGKGSSAKIVSSKLFSHDALYAVKVAEDMNAEGKQALGIYFKRRVMMLVLLGICLLYLVQGQLYTFVGRILDLLSGIA